MEFARTPGETIPAIGVEHEHGNCPRSAVYGLSRGTPAGQRINLEESISIGRLAELFQFWRKLDNLSRAMRHVASVDPR